MNSCAAVGLEMVSYGGYVVTPHVKVRYELKTPYRDGTTHVFLTQSTSLAN